MTRSTEYGFSLLELLIALALTSIMLAAVYESLFVLGRVTDAGLVYSSETDDTRLVRAYLRRQLTSMVPLTSIGSGERKLLFSGRRDSVEFVGHLPSHVGGGGLDVVRLSVRDDNLLLRHRKVWTTPAVTWSEHVLSENVESISIRYLDQSVDRSGMWVSDWLGRDSLPALIRFEFEPGGDGDGWEMVVPVRLRSPSGRTHLIQGA